jgi:hypothetical protein
MRIVIQNFKKQLSTISLVLLWVIFPFLASAQTAGVATFTQDGTFGVPYGVTSITVNAYGAGGGGGGGGTANKNGGGAGGGGGFSQSVLTVAATSSHAVTVGTGGPNGAAGGNGQNGGSTIFGNNLVVATGGRGGAAFVSPGGAGGAGGNTATSGAGTGTTAIRSGGTGATATATGSGAGGGAAGTTANGGNGTVNTAGTAGGGDAGVGGLGITSNTGAGLAGAVYGGGGGGGGGKSGGGKGADGFMRITFICPTANNVPAPTTADPSGIGCTAFTARWNALTGANLYQIDVATTNTFTAGTFVVTGATTTNLYRSVEGLTGATNYFVRVRAWDGCHWGPYSAVRTVQTLICYCASNATSTGWSSIANVKFNTIDNTSGGCVAYTNFRDINTVVFRGSSYGLTLTKATTCNTGNYAGLYRAWIDWNRDGDFDDAGELVLTNGATTTNDPFTASVTIPAGATIGTTTMRCIFREGATAPTQCGTYAYGETEDYSVIIQDLVACSGTPTAGTISPANTTGNPGTIVNFTWNGIPQTGLTYQWQQSTDGGTNWSNIAGATTANYTSEMINATTHFRLRITCTNSGIISTTNTAVVTIETSYCTHPSIDCSKGDVISRVRLESLDNASGTTCATAGYQNFTNLAPPTLRIGMSDMITINVGPGPNVTSGNPQYKHSLGFWIDFNQNGSWKDPGEFFYIGENNIDPNTEHSYTFQVPATALVGVTRMRIKYSRADVLLSAWDCNNRSPAVGDPHGEVEDYLVNIECPALPQEVSGRFPFFAAQMPCGAGITMRWEKATCATGYKLYLGTTNPPSDLVLNSTTENTYNTGPLTANTTYYWRVVPFNANGDGLVAPIWSFTTNTITPPPVVPDVFACAGASTSQTLTASGAVTGSVYNWYDQSAGGTLLHTGNPYTPNPALTVTDTFYVEQAALSAQQSISVHQTSPNVWCGTGGRVGIFFDVQAKTRDLIIDGFTVKCLTSTGGTAVTRRYDVFYRMTPYIANMFNNVGWVSLGQFSVASTLSTEDIRINLPTPFEIPAGATYGIYIVGVGDRDLGFINLPGDWDNLDLTVSQGTGTCGAPFPAFKAANFGFGGAVHYRTKCASARDTAIVYIMRPETNVILAYENTYNAKEQCTVDGWTYYANPLKRNEWIFAINKNGNTFQADVDIVLGPGVYQSINTAERHGSHLMRRYWNARRTSGTISSPVQVRFFIDSTEAVAAVNMRDAIWTSTYSDTYKVLWRWFKTLGSDFSPTTGINGNLFTFTQETGMTSLNSVNWIRNGVNIPYTSRTNNVAYIQLQNITAFSGGTGGVGFSKMVGTPLPVTLVNFDAIPNGNQVFINWSTESEINSDYFDVERSVDGVRFEKIARVNAAGFTNTLNNYSIIDKNPLSGKSYYKLVQFDFDGESSESHLVAVQMKNANNVVILPNPTSSSFDVNYFSENDGNILISVYDVTGKLVINKDVNISPGNTSVHFDVNLVPGIYNVVIMHDTERIIKKLVRN